MVEEDAGGLCLWENRRFAHIPSDLAPFFPLLWDFRDCVSLSLLSLFFLSQLFLNLYLFIYCASFVYLTSTFVYLVFLHSLESAWLTIPGSWATITCWGLWYLAALRPRTPNWTTACEMNWALFLTYIKKITQPGAPIYGVEIKPTQINNARKSFPQYAALKAIAKRYGMDKPMMHVCIASDSPVCYGDRVKVVGSEDLNDEEELKEGLEHLRVPEGNYSWLDWQPEDDSEEDEDDDDGGDNNGPKRKK